PIGCLLARKTQKPTGFQLGLFPLAAWIAAGRNPGAGAKMQLPRLPPKTPDRNGEFGALLITIDPSEYAAIWAAPGCFKLFYGPCGSWTWKTRHRGWRKEIFKNCAPGSRA